MAKVKQKSAAKTEEGLTPKQELFCQFYTSADRELFGNGTRSYLEAFSEKIEEGRYKMSFKVAVVLASRELTKVKVIERINSLLETGGFSDENVDKQHLFLINQHADLKTKMAAIREYNELKKRIEKKLELTLPKPIADVFTDAIQNSHGDEKDSGAQETD